MVAIATPASESHGEQLSCRVGRAIALAQQHDDTRFYPVWGCICSSLADQRCRIDAGVEVAGGGIVAEAAQPPAGSVEGERAGVQQQHLVT